MTTNPKCIGSAFTSLRSRAHLAQDLNFIWFFARFAPAFRDCVIRFSDSVGHPAHFAKLQTWRLLERYVVGWLLLFGFFLTSRRSTSGSSWLLNIWLLDDCLFFFFTILLFGIRSNDLRCRVRAKGMNATGTLSKRRYPSPLSERLCRGKSAKEINSYRAAWVTSKSRWRIKKKRKNKQLGRVNDSSSLSEHISEHHQIDRVHFSLIARSFAATQEEHDLRTLDIFS